MAKKEKPEKPILEKAAEAVGATLGAIAKKTGLAHSEPKPPKKSGKLEKKPKSKLPRREKKKAKRATKSGA